MNNATDELHPAGSQQRRWGLAVGVAATVAVTGALSFMAVVNHGGGEKASSKDLAVATMADAASYKSTGPADVEVFTIRLRPGGAIRWHSHPGFVSVAVISGTATFYEAEGTSCVRKTYKPGQAVVEAPGLIHTTKNEGKRDLEYLVYSMHPKGTNLGIPQPRPADCHH